MFCNAFTCKPFCDSIVFVFFLLINQVHNDTSLQSITVAFQSICPVTDVFLPAESGSVPASCGHLITLHLSTIPTLQNAIIFALVACSKSKILLFLSLKNTKSKERI